MANRRPSAPVNSIPKRSPIHRGKRLAGGGMPISAIPNPTYKKGILGVTRRGK